MSQPRRSCSILVCLALAASCTGTIDGQAPSSRPPTGSGDRTDPPPGMSNGGSGVGPPASAQSQHCLSDVYVSLANLLGVPMTTFGDPSVCKGPLPRLA